MKHASKPLVFKLDVVRENPEGKPHGDVHFVLNVRFAQRKRVTLCGLPTESMRTLGSPFDGFEDVLCADCDERTET